MFWDKGYHSYSGNRERKIVTKLDVDRWKGCGGSDTECNCWLFMPEKRESY